MQMSTTPVPQDIAAECKKCAKIINDFIKPAQTGLDQIIPPHIIAAARGVAVITVIKAGFLFSGRGGAGLVIARLDDGSWSAPSAIGTAGFGAGGQIGVEITDMVIILNTPEAVKAFSLGGNVTLGGNLSVAAGPIGRNAEAAGTVGKLSAIYSYSKTRGLFAGVSIEGSILIERKETNANFYRRKVTAKEILSGAVPPPPAAEDLYRALNRRSQYDEADEAEYKAKRAAGPVGFIHANVSNPAPQRQIESRGGRDYDDDGYRPRGQRQIGYNDDSDYPRRPSINRPPPPPPARPAGGQDRAVALYDFAGDRDGDLPFRKGETIVILKRDPSEWWTGRCNGQEGVFPANYVQV